MSSTCSSFSNLTDLANEFEADYQDALKEIEALKKKNVALEVTVHDLKEKMRKMTEEEEDILTSIVGSWSIVSSTGMEEYLKKCKPTDIDDALFQIGVQHYEYEQDYVTMSITLGTSERWRSSEKMAREAPNEEESILTSIVGSWKIVSSVGMKEFLEKLNPSPLMSAYYQLANHHFENHNGVLTTSVSVGISEVHRETLTIGERTENRLCFIENNTLIWVFFKPDGEEYARAEHFVKDGRYYTVTQRFGMKCTRVYEKVGTEKKKDLRIAELESELEMLKVEKNGEVEKLKEELEVLKVERNQEKEQFIALLEEKNADIEELIDEVEILEEEKIENEKKVEAEKEEREKFVERLREEIDTLIDEKTKNMDERRKKEKKKLEKMKKELEEKALKDDSAESEEEISFEWFFNRQHRKENHCGL